MWTVLAEPLYLHPCHWCAQRTDSQLPHILSNENCHIDKLTWCFYCEVSPVDDSGCLRALWRTTCIRSNRRYSGISSGGSGTAPRRPPTETRPALAGEGNFTHGEGRPGGADQRASREYPTTEGVAPENKLRLIKRRKKKSESNEKKTITIKVLIFYSFSDCWKFRLYFTQAPVEQSRSKILFYIYMCIF